MTGKYGQQIAGVYAREIVVGDRRIPYTLHRSARARRLRISIYPGRDIRVALPRRFSVRAAEDFVRKKAGWILRHWGNASVSAEPSADRVARRADYLRHCARACAIAKDRLHHFNAFYGFRYRRVAVKMQTTLWGSCSAKKNLNFNYRIALIPPHLADYVIVHELCHLQEMNHSTTFWNLMSRAIPDWRDRRRELRGYDHGGGPVGVRTI